MNENRKGVYPTMITPFAKEGGVDFKGVEALTEWYWKKGCDGRGRSYSHHQSHGYGKHVRAKMD